MSDQVTAQVLRPYVIIPCDIAKPVELKHWVEPDVDIVQKLLGGYMEVVRLSASAIATVERWTQPRTELHPYAHIVMVVNEDGIRKELRPNRRAILLYGAAVVGDVVVLDLRTNEEIAEQEGAAQPANAGDIWVLHYHHGHGEDLWFFSTHVKAVAGVAKLAETYFGEWRAYDNNAARVETMRALLADPTRHEEIEDAWVTYTDGHESFWIECSELDLVPG